MLLVRNKNKFKIKLTMLVRGASLLFVVISFSNQILSANCEAKEFDWSDLGVSLSGAKSALTGSPNNLRILVSPQRRMTKNYEFDYSNSSQPIQSEANYVIPGSSGSYPTSSQNVQSAAHSNAYSALSASLASLKSRLNARGVTLAGSPLADSSSIVGGSNGAYSSGVVSSSYNNPSDPSQQQQQQQTQHSAGSNQQQQPAYLSVSSGIGSQDSSSSSAGGYSVSASSHGQGNDNKTIVLAIPAKINFLTDAHLNKQQQQTNQQQQQHHQQQQQAALAEQQQQQQQLIRQPIEYSTGTKQISIGQDGGVSGLEHSINGAQIVSTNQVTTLDGQPLTQDQQQQQQQQLQLTQYPQQQYVIVNSTPTANELQQQYQQQQYIAAPSGLIQPASVYSNLYSKLQTSNLGSIAMKYIPTAVYQQQALPSTTIQLPQVQKVYATTAEQQQQAQLHQALPAAAVVVDIEDQTNRYTCLDTCNSADPRWRHASVSRYKYCCSRSAQYDLSQLSVDHPSVEKLSESTKTADDAYYSYLYRKTRARRSRRPHKSYRYRYPTGAGGSPVSGSLGSSSSSTGTSSSQESEEAASVGMNGGNGYGQHHESGQQQQQQTILLSASGGRLPSSSSGFSYYDTYPYMKYYNKNRQQPALSYEPPSSSDVQSGKYDAPESSPSSGGKYSNNKERPSYRRARARDYNSNRDQYQDGGQSELQNEDDSQAYPPPSTGSYGSGEYSVEGRYPLSEPQHPSVEHHVRQPYYSSSADEEPAGLEPSGKGGYSQYQDGEEVNYGKGSGSAAGPSSSDDYSSQDQAGEDGQMEPQHEVNSYQNKYVSPAVTVTTTKAARKYKNQYSRPTTSSRKYKQHIRKNRKNGGKYSNKQESSSQTNGTDYDSALAGHTDSNGYHHPGTSTEHQQANNNSEQQDNEHQQQQQYQKDSSSSTYNNSGENSADSNGSEKETAMSLNNKYKSSLNDSTVANLSRTTMHLKEILSLLEKKAHLKLTNESTSTTGNQQQVIPTSTPAPITTTSIYPLSSLFNSPALQNALSNDYLTSEFGLKSPYRFEPSSLTSAITAPGLGLSSSFGSDPLSSLTNFNPTQFGLPPTKHLSFNSPPQPHSHQQRKRRPNKNVRYNSNGMVLPKAHGLGNQTPHSSSFGMPVKNPYMNSGYYQSLQYPFWLTRSNSASVTNAYPYRNLNKNPYTSLLTGPLTSKLAAAAAASSGLYTDDSRFHGSNPYDSLANVASSLRPSTTMRLRSKPLVFQPHVLPIYTRHSILAQDVKK